MNSTNVSVMKMKQKFIMLLTIASLVIYIGLRPHYLLLHDVVNRHDAIDANRHCKPLLCIFTTFKPGVYKIPVTIMHATSRLHSQHFDYGF